MKILLALSGDPREVEERLVAELAKQGETAEIAKAVTIHDLERLTDGERFDGIVTQLKFALGDFSTTELIALREKHESSVLVIVLPQSFKGGKYVEELFRGDVRNGLFAKDGGAPNIIRLIRNPRTRANARLYYGLADKITTDVLEEKKTDENEIVKFADFITNGFPDKPDASLEERVDRVASVVTKQELKNTFNILSEEIQEQIKEFPKYKSFFVEAKKQYRTVDAVEKKPESAIATAIKAFGDKRNARKEAEAEKAEQRAIEKAEAEQRKAKERERDEQLEKEESERRVAEKAEADKRRAEEEREKAERKAEEDRIRAERKAEEDRIKAEQKAEEEKLKAAQRAEDEKRKAEARAKAEAEREAARAKAEAEKAIAEKARAEAERAKAEAEKAKAEQRAREIEREEAERKHQRELEKIKAAAEKERKADERRLKLVEAKPEIVIEKRLVRSRVIGVIGLYRGAGTTSTAVSLAKTISEHDAVTLIEVPGAKKPEGAIFNDYELDKKIGPAFKSVPHLIADGETNLIGISNTCENISFFVPDPQNESLEYDSQLIASMIYGTSNHVVIDLGGDIEDAKERGFLNCLTDLVLVYEAEQEEAHIQEIRDQIKEIELNGNIEPFIIRVQAKGVEKTKIDGAKILNVRKLYTRKIVPLAISSAEEKELMQDLNISEKKRTSLFGKTKKVIVRQGTEDIGVIGTEHGVGTTHTAFMLAAALSKSYKVALVELNGSEQMASLAREIGRGKKTPVKMDGIDLYFDVTYEEFAAKNRTRYDFVVVDFGTLKESARRREAYALCGKKFLVFDAAPWKLSNFDFVVEQYVTDFDEGRQMVLLAPGADATHIRNYNLRNRGGKREIRAVPLAKFPLNLDEETTKYMQRLVLG